MTTRSDGPSRSRPAGVTVSIAALAIALLLGVAILAFGWGEPLVALVTGVVVGGLIVGAALRRNWARWALVVLTIVATATSWPLLRIQLSYGIVVPAATVVQFVLELLGLILLFRPVASAWYRGQPRGM